MVYYQDSDPEVRRVRYEVRNFKSNLFTYLAVVSVLFFMNLLSGGFWGDGLWGLAHVLFLIALIWGIVLALQAARLFGDHIGHEWENRMVDGIMARRRGDWRYAPPQGPIVTPAPSASAPPNPPAV